jgi:hypothetical protein
MSARMPALESAHGCDRVSQVTPRAAIAALLLALCVTSVACADEPPAPPPAWMANAVGLPVDSRCSACHEPPQVARALRAPSDVARITVRRSATGHTRGVEHSLELLPGKGARSSQASGDIGAYQLQGFAPREPASARCVVPDETWRELSKRVAADALLAIEGQAITQYATHVEGARVTVDWSDGSVTTVASLAIAHDDEHPSFAALLADIERLAAPLDWVADP